MEQEPLARRHTPLPPRRLEGGELVAQGRGRVLDFWRWAYSDLRDNTSRGVLAEWLVGLALGCVDGVRSAWGNYDLLTPAGIRVEVKSAAYLQAWPTDRHSRIQFGGLLGLAWDERTGTYDTDPSYRADVYVFAVLAATDHAGLDPLDIEQWRFWVASKEVVAQRNSRTLALWAVEQIASGPLQFDDLAAAVAAANSSN